MKAFIKSIGLVDKKGNVYKTGSYIVSEIFFGEFYDKLQSSYYELKNAIYYLNYIRREHILNCVTTERKKRSKSIKLNM